jgi:hypothetical protein
MSSNSSRGSASQPENARAHVRLDQGISRHCRHRLAGGNALSAAAVRLPLRRGEGLGAIGNLQDDGAAAASRHHQPGHDRHLAIGPLARLARPRFALRVVRFRLATGQIRVGACALRPARLVRTMGARLRYRPQPAFTEILSYYQRSTGNSDGGNRHSRGGETVLTVTSC